MTDTALTMNYDCLAWIGWGKVTDANGNMTYDRSRGITGMTYNALNLPEKAEFSDGSETTWKYSGSGVKLEERHVSADGMSTRTLTYAGDFVLYGHAFQRYETPWGYLRAGSTHFHAYIRDYQGSIVGVADASVSGSLLQFTDYYPYGLPHDDATGVSVNRRKYGGKEYMTESGLNELDYGARHMLPQYGCFTSPDPLAGDNRSVSAWAYCNGDPVNNTDPTGMSTEVLKRADGTYQVTGGKLYDDDLGIYVVKPGLGLFTYYVRTGERIGETTSITSFYNSDKKSWAVGSIIDMNDNSGKMFLNDIVEDTPSLLYYMQNAANNKEYDFKATNGNYFKVNGTDKYRGMAIGTNDHGLIVITSARDIGNIAAGYVAGYHGVAWNDARLGFDAYQFTQNYSFEGPSTCNAERLGWLWGIHNSSVMGRMTLIHGSAMSFSSRMATYLATDLFRILKHNPWK